MTPYASALLLAALVFAQTTLMPAAALGTAKPFLPLLAVVSWGLLASPLAGAWWAVGAGLMLDVVSPSPSLFYTLPMVGAAVVIAAGRGRMFPSNLFTPWLVTAVATAAFWLLQRALLPLVGGAVTWHLDALTRELLPEMALNLLWLPVVYLPLRALARHASGPRMEWER
jgi:rod shape-determining protein MreD